MGIRSTTWAKHHRRLSLIFTEVCSLPSVYVRKNKCHRSDTWWRRSYRCCGSFLLQLERPRCSAPSRLCSQLVRSISFRSGFTNISTVLTRDTNDLSPYAAQQQNNSSSLLLWWDSDCVYHDGAPRAAAVRPDRPIGGVLSPFASLSTASPGFTSKPQIPKFINKSAEEERRGGKKKKNCTARLLQTPGRAEATHAQSSMKKTGFEKEANQKYGREVKKKRKRIFFLLAHKAKTTCKLKTQSH